MFLKNRHWCPLWRLLARLLALLSMPYLYSRFVSCFDLSSTKRALPLIVPGEPIVVSLSPSAKVPGALSIVSNRNLLAAPATAHQQRAVLLLRLICRFNDSTSAAYLFLRRQRHDSYNLIVAGRRPLNQAIYTNLLRIYALFWDYPVFISFSTVQFVYQSRLCRRKPLTHTSLLESGLDPYLPTLRFIQPKASKVCLPHGCCPISSTALKPHWICLGLFSPEASLTSPHTHRPENTFESPLPAAFHQVSGHLVSYSSPDPSSPASCRLQRKHTPAYTTAGSRLTIA